MGLPRRAVMMVSGYTKEALAARLPEEVDGAALLRLQEALEQEAEA